MTYDVIRYRVLDLKVLAVATRRVEGAWSCYIGPCPGDRHDREVQDVAAWGSKQDEALARFLFPEIDLPYAR